MRLCERDECGRRFYGKGLCAKHYMQERDALPPRECAAEGCPKIVRNLHGWCVKHREAPKVMPCGRCGEVQPVEAFVRHAAVRRADKKGWYCDPCIEARRVEALKRAKDAGSRFKRHGITAADFDELLEAQDGRCGVCSRTFGEDDRIEVDHDHACCPTAWSCGACVRGLLHPTCNRALGLFGDSIDALRGAIRYLGGEA